MGTMHNPAHPGEVLRELYLEPLGLNVTTAAAALGVTRSTLTELVKSRSRLTPVMACAWNGHSPLALSIGFGCSRITICGTRVVPRGFQGFAGWLGKLSPSRREVGGRLARIGGLRSKTLAAPVGIKPVELKVGRQTSTVLAQPREQFLGGRRPGDLERPRAGCPNLDGVAFLEPERFDNGPRNAHGQTISPFDDARAAQSYTYLAGANSS